MKDLRWVIFLLPTLRGRPWGDASRAPIFCLSCPLCQHGILCVLRNLFATVHGERSRWKQNKPQKTVSEAPAVIENQRENTWSEMYLLDFSLLQLNIYFALKYIAVDGVKIVGPKAPKKNSPLPSLPPPPALFPTFARTRALSCCYNFTDHATSVFMVQRIALVRSARRCLCCLQ